MNCALRTSLAALFPSCTVSYVQSYPYAGVLPTSAMLFLLALKLTAAYNPASVRVVHPTQSGSLSRNIQRYGRHSVQMLNDGSPIVFDAYEEYIVRSCSEIETTTLGVRFVNLASEKEPMLVGLDADDMVKTFFTAPWGHTVLGKDAGNGWIYIQDMQYLPIKVGSDQVLHKVDEQIIAERTKTSQKQLEREIWKVLADAGRDNGGNVTYSELADLMQQQLVQRWLQGSSINVKRSIDEMAQMPWTHKSSTGRVNAQRFFEMLKQQSLDAVKIVILEHLADSDIKDIAQFLSRHHDPSHQNLTFWEEFELRPLKEPTEGAQSAIILAKEGNEIIGHVAVNHWVLQKDGSIRYNSQADKVSDGEQVIPLLVGVTVREDKRGSGLGRRLVQEAEEHVKTWKRHDELYLKVEEKNKAAVKAYRNAGFKAFGKSWFWLRGDYYFPEKTMELMMKKPLVQMPQ